MKHYGDMEVTVYINEAVTKDKRIIYSEIELFAAALDDFLKQYAKKNKLINFALDELQEMGD